MKKIWVVAASLAVMFLSGCSDDVSNQAPAKPVEKKTQESAVVQASPMVDVKPENYVQLQSGRQLVGLYWASAKRSVDYGDAATALYQKYAAEKNELLRDGMLKDLNPEIDAEIDKARNVKFLLLEPDSPYSWVGNYDAEYKIFPVATLNEGNTKYSFNDADSYSISFNNQRAFSRFSVADPALVEKIEKLKRNFAFAINVYVRITGAQSGSNVLEADIQKVQLLDKDKNVLVEINK